MPRLIKQLVSIPLIFTLTLEATPAQMRAPATQNYLLCRYPPNIDLAIKTQAISPKLESGNASLSPKGFSQLASEFPSVRHFHRPGPVLNRIARLIRWFPLLHERFQKRIDFYITLHDELSQRKGINDSYLTQSLIKEWQEQLSIIAGTSVEIIPDATAESQLGLLRDEEGDEPYVAIAQSRVSAPDKNLGHIFRKSTIFLKEALFHISDPELRRFAIGIVLGHEQAEIWIKTHENAIFTRTLIRCMTFLGAQTIDQKIERSAKLLTLGFYALMGRQLKKIVKTPPVQLHTLINLYKTENPGADSSEIYLIEAAYWLADKHYRPDNQDKMYPSGESYSSKTTRDARDLIRQGGDASTVATALLQELPKDAIEVSKLQAALEDIHTFKAFKWLDEQKTANIAGLIKGLKYIQQQPSKLHFPKDRPNYVIQRQNQYEIQLIKRIAQENAVPYDSLLLLTWVHFTNVFPTINSETQENLFQRAASVMKFVLSPLSERHGRGLLAREISNAVFKFLHPQAYQETKTRFRKLLGMTHEQAQEFIPKISDRLGHVVREKYGIVLPKLPRGTSPLGRRNPNGREKWYWSAFQKGIGDTPIEDQKDPIGWMVVVKTTEDLERIRHSLDEDIGTEELLTERVGQRTRVIRDPQGHIAYQLSNFRFENPYDPTHTVIAELQIMTEEYHQKHYISGVSPAAYRYPHWWLEPKRDADIEVFQEHQISMKQGQQYNIEDPTLTGDLLFDSAAIAEKHKTHLYVQVTGTPLKHENSLKDNSKNISSVEWNPLELHPNALGIDVIMHPSVGGSLDRRPKIWRLEAFTNDQNNAENPRYTWRKIGLSDPIKPGDTIVVDEAADNFPLAETEIHNLLQAATSPWAHMILRNLTATSTTAFNSRRASLIEEGRALMNTTTEGKSSLPDYIQTVITPLILSMDFENLEDFYVALALASEDEKSGKTYEDSPFIRAKTDYDDLLQRQYVTYHLGSRSISQNLFSIDIHYDEDQIGVLADCIQFLSTEGANITGWTQEPGERGTGTLTLLVPMVSGHPISSLTKAIKSKLYRRRGQSPPPEDGRRLQVTFEVSTGKQTLDRFANEMKRLKIAIEEGHQLPQPQTYSCILNMPRIEEEGREKNGVTLLEKTMENLIHEGLIETFAVHDAPMTDSTRDNLLAILRNEQQLFPNQPGILSNSTQQNLLPAIAASHNPGPIDDGMISDFHRALNIMYRYLGHPRAENAWARQQYRRNGDLFASHAIASTYALIHEAKQRYARAILRQLLYTVVREGPENVWRQIRESTLPELAKALTTEGINTKSQDDIVRRLTKRFPDIKPELWKEAAMLSAEQTKPSQTLIMLHAKLIPLARAEIENQIISSFPMYGPEMILTINDLDVSPQEMLARGSTISREAAKMIECEHDLQTHEDLSRKIPKTLFEYLPIIMNHTQEITNEWDQEQYLFSRRYFLRTLILNTNSLPEIVPKPDPGMEMGAYYRSLLESTQKFLIFMGNEENRPIFDSLVTPEELSQFRSRLDHLAQLLEMILHQSQKITDIQIVPMGLEPAFEAAFGPYQHINEATAALVIQFLLHEASLLTPKERSRLPIQPESHMAYLWESVDTALVQKEFMTQFMTVWNIANTLDPSRRVHRINVLMELIQNILSRDVYSLLSSLVLSVFDKKGIQDSTQVRARFQESLPPNVSKRLLANIQIARSDTPDASEFENLKLYGSPGLIAARAMDIAVSLNDLSDADHASSLVSQALRLLNVLTPQNSDATHFTLWTIRRYIHLLSKVRGLNLKAQPRTTKRIIQQFATGITAVIRQNYIPQGSESIQKLLARLSAIKEKGVHPRRKPPSTSALRKEERLRGFIRAFLRAYIHMGLFLAVAAARNYFSHHASLESLIVAWGVILLGPAILAVIAWLTAIWTHETLGHIRVALKNYREVRLANYFGHWVVVGIPKTRIDTPYDLPIINDPEVRAAGPKASYAGYITAYIILITNIAQFVFYILSSSAPAFLTPHYLISHLLSYMIPIVFIGAFISASDVFRKADQEEIKVPKYELGDEMNLFHTTLTGTENPASLLGHLLNQLPENRVGRYVSLEKDKEGNNQISIGTVRSMGTSIKGIDNTHRKLMEAQGTFSPQASELKPSAHVASLHRRRLLIHLTYPKELSEVIQRVQDTGAWIDRIRPTIYKDASYFELELMGPEGEIDVLQTSLLREKLASRWNISEFELEDYVKPKISVTSKPNSIFKITIENRFQKPETLKLILETIVANGCSVLDYSEDTTKHDGYSEMEFTLHKNQSIRGELDLRNIQILPTHPTQVQDSRPLRLSFYLLDVPGALMEVADIFADLNIKVIKGRQDPQVTGHSHRMVEFQVLTNNDIEQLRSALSNLRTEINTTDKIGPKPLVNNLEIVGNISQAEANTAAFLIKDQIDNASTGDKTVEHIAQPEHPRATNVVLFASSIFGKSTFLTNIEQALDILNLANANPETIEGPARGWRWLPKWLIRLIKYVTPPTWYVKWLYPNWLPMAPQIRKSNGEAYVLHPKRTAFNLLARGVRNGETITEALLHDSKEDIGKNIWAGVEAAGNDAFAQAMNNSLFQTKINLRKQKEFIARYERYFENAGGGFNPVRDVKRYILEAEIAGRQFAQESDIQEFARAGDQQAIREAMMKRFELRRKNLTPANEQLCDSLVNEGKVLLKREIENSILGYPIILLHHIDLLSNDEDYESYARDLIERGLSDLLLIKFEEQRDNLRSIWEVGEKSVDFPTKSIAKNIRYIAPIAFSEKYKKSEIDKDVLRDYFDVLIRQSTAKDKNNDYLITSLPVYYERNKKSGETEDVDSSREKMMAAMRTIRMGLLSDTHADFLPQDINPQDMKHFIDLLESRPTDAPAKTAKPKTPVAPQSHAAAATVHGDHKRQLASAG